MKAESRLTCLSGRLLLAATELQAGSRACQSAKAISGSKHLVEASLPGYTEQCSLLRTN